MSQNKDLVRETVSDDLLNNSTPESLAEATTEALDDTDLGGHATEDKVDK